MRTNRPFFEMKYKLIEYTVQRSFNSDVVYCLAYSSLSCQEFSLGIFSHFSQRHRKKTKKHMKSEQRQFDIIFSLLLPIKKCVSVCVSVWPGCSLKRSFFHLMICHEFMTRISSRIELYFCCFTKISPLIAHTHIHAHYTCNLYA